MGRPKTVNIKKQYYRKKIPLITNDVDLMRWTVGEIVGCHDTHAFKTDNLHDAWARLPLQCVLAFDKINGLWIFSNQDESDWPQEIGNIISGVNFTFACLSPDTAMASGIHYYYHLKLEND